jgi:flagellar assembly protein FliH
MSMSSSAEFDSVFAVPIRALEYHDIAAHPASDGAMQSMSEYESAGGPLRAEVELSEEEFAERIKRERSDATLKAEERLRQEYELKLQAARAPIAASVRDFETQRADYYARVEAEVVQLSLAIAAKILHREAQVDPMLVATLVRIAVDKLREGSRVVIRVAPRIVPQWQEYFAGQTSIAAVEIAGDAELSDQDCLLETELGTANFGLDTQLKEVERGFFDLLALRPASR